MAGLMRRWLGDETLTYDLIAGLSGVIAAEIVPWLWRLTQQLRRLGLDEILLANPPDETLPALRSTSQAAPFLSELDAFLRRHGHRCMTEAEWLHARWWEDPAPVMASLAQYLREGLVLDPAEAEAQQRSKRLATTAAVEARLKAWQRAYFRFGLRRLQRQMLLRDNGQHYAVRLLLPQRRLYAALGARWAERGWLGRAEDFFFLTVAEVESVLVAGNPRAVALDLPAIVAARREAHAYWLTQPAYETLDAAGQPVGAAGDQHGVFSGIAASPGRVTGLARVVAGPAEAGRLQAGEILVTRATDPGWTPLFARLGGLVLEVGGQLSHGAIVAREYGIPAVVNVAEATRRIADGQRLTVDGGTGQVTVAATDGARSGER